MKKKGIILIIVGGLTLSSLSHAYGASINNESRLEAMSRESGNSALNCSVSVSQEPGIQQSGDFGKMIQIMKENGFVNEANAIERGDFESMKNFMNNISESDYNKIIDIMKNNGYEYMANMMESIGREGISKYRDGMM